MQFVSWVCHLSILEMSTFKEYEDDDIDGYR